MFPSLKERLSKERIDLLYYEKRSNPLQPQKEYSDSKNNNSILNKFASSITNSTELWANK